MTEVSLQYHLCHVEQGNKLSTQLKCVSEIQERTQFRQDVQGQCCSTCGYSHDVHVRGFTHTYGPFDRQKTEETTFTS